MSHKGVVEFFDFGISHENQALPEIEPCLH